jgi:hypothetical protein
MRFSRGRGPNCHEEDLGLAVVTDDEPQVYRRPAAVRCPSEKMPT